MSTISKRAVLEEAGRVAALRKDLAAKQGERDKLEQEIKLIERNLARAVEAFDATWDKLGQPGDGRARNGSDGEDPLTPGKLPHRVLIHMRHDPTAFHTAAAIAGDLKIRDVQQVRTALARLVSKGLVRRAGVKGEFSL
jgi:hypothetical protein